MFGFLLLFIPVMTHLNYDSNCLETESRFGIPFCMQCQPNYKITTFNKCVPCSSDSDCPSYTHQSNTQSIINKYYSSKDYQYYKNYPYFHQDTTHQGKNVYDMTFSGFIKQDPNCMKKSSTGRCFQCRIQYEYNQKTRICEHKPNQDIEEKLRSLNCLFFSQVTNKCLECSTNYGRKRNGTCAYGIKDEDLSSDELSPSDAENPIKVQSRDNLFQRNQIQIPIKTKQLDKFKINNFNQRVFFLIDQKFHDVDGRDHQSNDDKGDHQSNDDKGDDESNDDKGDDGGDDKNDDDSEESQRGVSRIYSIKNCKKVKNGRCKKCQQGYILNLLIMGTNESPCKKISNPIVSLLPNSYTEEQYDEIQSIITEHLRRHQRFYDDDKCTKYNGNQDNNEPKCLKCLQRYYFSFKEDKCIQVDENCKKYNSKTGYCYYCKYGYMPVSGKCKLMNTQNYQKGYNQYYSSYRSRYYP